MLGTFRNSMEAGVEQDDLGEGGGGELEDLLDRGWIKEELDWDVLLSRQGSHWRILSRRMFKFAPRSFQLPCRK